ncbi:MAG TPA: hypothetical protein PKH03_08085 [Syntrophales bacterium]|nr:hypothetical protein [Syntrophales bacterium]
MKTFWEKLTKSQQIFLGVGAAVVLLLLVVQFLMLPFVEAKARARKSIAAHEKILHELVPLGVEYRLLTRQVEEMQRIFARRPADFSLFSYCEKKTGEAGIKANVKSINPTRIPLNGPYEEALVDMKIDRITLAQLTQFLYLVESPQDLIRVKKIAIAKMKDTPEYLQVSVQAATYQASGGAATGRGGP